MAEKSKIREEIKGQQDNLTKAEEILKEIEREKGVFENIYKTTLESVRYWDSLGDKLRAEFAKGKLEGIKDGIGVLGYFLRRFGKGNPNPGNPNPGNPDLPELPKFESYGQLSDFLTMKGYVRILDDVEEMEFQMRPSGWKKKDVQENILEWWNRPLDTEPEPSVLYVRPGYFIFWHFKREIAKRLKE